MIPALYPYLTFFDFVAFLNIFNHSVETFEESLRQKFQSKYCITYSSGRAGLYHILKANGIKNKKVLVSAYTCCVVTEAVVQSGNTPVFVDTCKGSFNAEIENEDIEKYIPNLGAVIVTNLYGLTDFSKSELLNNKARDFLLILDDALTPGDISDGNKDVYDYIFISGGVRKPFTCLGGGVVFTDSENNFKALKVYTVERRKIMGNFLKIKFFLFASLFFLSFRIIVYPFVSFVRHNTGFLNSFFNERNNDIHKEVPEYFEDMCDFQKRIGYNQLNKLEKLLDKRKKIGNIYYELLKPTYPWISEFWKKDTAYSHVPFLHPERDLLEKYLLKHGIDTERYFDYSVPELKQYKHNGKYPNAEHLSKQMINLPINMGLTESDIKYIVDKIIEFDVVKNSNSNNT